MEEYFLVGFQHGLHKKSLDVVFSPLPLCFISLSVVSFFPSPFVDVLFGYALEYAIITSLLIF